MDTYRWNPVIEAWEVQIPQEPVWRRSYWLAGFNEISGRLRLLTLKNKIESTYNDTVTFYEVPYIKEEV